MPLTQAQELIETLRQCRIAPLGRVFDASRSLASGEGTAGTSEHDTNRLQPLRQRQRRRYERRQRGTPQLTTVLSAFRASQLPSPSNRCLPLLKHISIHDSTDTY
jgi:hypothetical protein